MKTCQFLLVLEAVAWCVLTPLQALPAQRPALPLVLHPKDFHHPTPEDVEFRLYTRLTRDGPPEVLVLGNLTTLHGSHWASHMPLTVLVHGYSETADDSPWMVATKNSLLARADVNVVVVQWAVLADGIRYDRAADNVRFVGLLLADLLHFLQNNTADFTGGQVHLIGFSLGAHVTGVAGHHYPGVARITGLDPAGPFFESQSLANRLDASDASFVDVVHTNAGRLVTGHFGFREPAGQVDFYVNGGSSQYGCPNFIWDSIVDIITLQPDDIDACSHGRAHQYFLESLTAAEPTYGYHCADYETFQGGTCFNTSRAQLGYDVARNSTGVFYLNTQGEAPFFSRHVRMTLTVGCGESSYHGRLLLKAAIPDRDTRQVKMFSGWPALHPGDVHLATLTVPLATDLATVEILVEFHKSFFLPFSPDHLNVQSILALDTHTQDTLLMRRSEWWVGRSHLLHTLVSI
ncbi:inactive pancreatic lipase-related protein 1-like isoform X2 [Panulirus ornatus]|uniref:inactive pancreatic lipase-related protein 1-like isoform X2 n=1 Tax=Panulirus ornatus TaxID=150431 RepID=UPI003A877E48